MYLCISRCFSTSGLPILGFRVRRCLVTANSGQATLPGIACMPEAHGYFCENGQRFTTSHGRIRSGAISRLTPRMIAQSRVIAKGKRIHDVQRLVVTYGGRPAKWVKK